MTTANQSVHLTDSPDGSAEGVIDTLSPSAGEVYYVDYVLATGDGAGVRTTVRRLKHGII